MVEFFKKVSITSIITSLVFAIFGIVMLINPAETTQMLALILGITVMVVGIEKIISYFVLRGNLDFYNYELVYGIIAIVASIIMITHVNTFSVVVRIVIGAWITCSGLMRLLYSLRIKNLGVSSWWAVLAMAVLTIIAGIYIICTQNTLVVIFAAILIVYAVIDIVEQLIFMKNINKLLE